jgi:hypothetical protein
MSGLAKKGKAGVQREREQTRRFTPNGDADTKKKSLIPRK